MNNIKISTSKIDREEKSIIFDMVEMMGGRFCGDLIESLNILITNNVRSNKYKMANSRNMSVVTPKWVYHVWSLSSKKVEIDVYDKFLLKLYSVPIFNNLTVCLSGFSVEEKKKYATLITCNGGRYFADLKINEVDFLITNDTCSKKYEYALLWNITVVKIDWLNESIKNGYCQSDCDYQIKYKTDTLIKSPFGVINSINIDDRKMFTNCRMFFIECPESFVNEWSRIIENRGGVVVTEVMKMSENITHNIVGNDNALTDRDLQRPCVKKDWLEESLKAGLLLSSDSFLIENSFNANSTDNNSKTYKKDMYSQIVRSNSFNNVVEDDKICEVLTEDDLTLLIDEIDNDNKKCTKEVCKSKDFGDFFDDNKKLKDKIDNEVKLITASINNESLFKNCTIAFLNCHKQFIDKWTTIIDNHGGKAVVFKENQSYNITHVIVDDNNVKVKCNLRNLCLRKKWLDDSFLKGELYPLKDYLVLEQKPTEIVDEDELWMNGINIEIKSSESTLSTLTTSSNETILFNARVSPNGLFNNLKFFLDKALSEFSTKKLITLITNLSGKITDKAEKAQFIVTNLLINYPYKCLESVFVVTEYFVMDCILMKRILSTLIDFLYTPLIIEEKHRNILTKCVIFFSGFNLEEFSQLKIYSNGLGAIVQEMIDITTDMDMYLVGTTHMIVKKENTTWIDNAIQLKIPIVTKNWLGKCGQDCRIANVNNFLVISNQILTENNQCSEKIMQYNKESERISDILTMNEISTTKKRTEINLKRVNSSKISSISSKISKENDFLAIQEKPLEIIEENNDVKWGYEVSGDEFRLNKMIENSEKEKKVENGESKKSAKVSIAMTPVSINNTPRKVFMLCSSTMSNILKLKSDIKTLGGELSEETMMNDNVTHFICSELNRTEKCLSSIASGKWILHPLFVFDSLQKGVWQMEEQYEWGNPLTNYLPKFTREPLKLKLALSGFRYRRNGGRAFKTWKVLFVDFSTKGERILNILRMGGAKIITGDLDKTTSNQVTHAFYKGGKDSLPKHPLSLHFKWLKMDFISTFLIEEKLPLEKMFQYSSSQIKEINISIKKHNEPWKYK